MKKPLHHPGDVSIGNGEWIRFVDITSRQENAVNLDALIHPMESFWRALEVNCVAECCGINAHSFWPQDIWNAVRKCQDTALMMKLSKLRDFINGHSANCVYSAILNQYIDRQMCLKLIDHVILTVSQMRPGLPRE